MSDTNQPARIDAFAEAAAILRSAESPKNRDEVNYKIQLAYAWLEFAKTQSTVS